MKLKLWTLLMVLLAVFIVAMSVIDTMNDRPLSPLTMLVLASYAFTYCIVRIAEAWHIRLWDS